MTLTMKIQNLQPKSGSESNGNYSKDEEMKLLTRSIESSICDHSDAYILLTGKLMLQVVIIIQK